VTGEPLSAGGTSYDDEESVDRGDGYPPTDECGSSRGWARAADRQPLRASNNRPGIEGLAGQLDAMARQGGFDGITLASEATGWYWLGPFYTLTRSCQMPLELYALIRA